MSPQEKTLIRETWDQVGPNAEQAAALFYERLFEIDPDLRVIFANVDLRNQRRKLVQALCAVVEGLDRIEDLVPQLEALGRRHAGYGAKESHYDSVGAALLWTLEQGLGASWTPQARSAWTAAYRLVAETMQGAAMNPCNSQPSQAASQFRA